MGLPPAHPPTPPAPRADRLAGRLEELEVEAMLVTHLVNVRYLTGYSGSNGLAVIGAEQRIFITDFRYVTQAAEEVDVAFERRRAPQELFQDLADVLGERRLRLGFEESHLTVKAHRRLRELLPEPVELIAVDGAVEALRRVKDQEEIERIRAAARLADEALEQVLAQGLVGRSERAVALALEVAMRELGAQRPSFDSIVAAGPHGALPHASPREVTIEPGQLVVIDWGAELDGYCSDCTRTVATGELSEHDRELYALTLSAQLAGLEGVRSGRPGREIDGVARQVIADGGHGEDFGHSLGHGVGMEVHEAPRLSATSEDTLETGNVLTVEPGIYLPGEAGVRIEDLVVVGERGPEILTGISKELRVVE